jgi:hypothetical protein
MAKIYESSDNGETVYVRDMGSTDRKLHYVSSKQTDIINRIREDQLWDQIRILERTHPALQAELDRVIMFYNLIKDDNR